MTDNDELLDLEQVGAALHISRATLYHRIADKRVPEPIKVKGRSHWRAKDIIPRPAPTRRPPTRRPVDAVAEIVDHLEREQTITLEQWRVLEARKILLNCGQDASS